MPEEWWRVMTRDFTWRGPAEDGDDAEEKACAAYGHSSEEYRDAEISVEPIAQPPPDAPGQLLLVRD
jgi:hypothetical protein